MRKVGHSMGEAESVIPLRRARATGAEALAEILHAHRPLICGLARRVAGDDAEAEDLIQEALVAVATSMNRFRGDCKLGTVKSRLHHARQALRTMMAPYLAESGGETS